MGIQLPQDIAGFAADENVVFDCYVRERDQTTPLVNAATATVTIYIARREGDATIVSKNLSLTDAPTGLFRGILSPAELADLNPDTEYFHNIFSDDGAGVIIRQARGKFVRGADVYGAP